MNLYKIDPIIGPRPSPIVMAASMYAILLIFSSGSSIESKLLQGIDENALAEAYFQYSNLKSIESKLLQGIDENALVNPCHALKNMATITIILFDFINVMNPKHPKQVLSEKIPK